MAADCALWITVGWKWCWLGVKEVNWGWELGGVKNCINHFGFNLQREYNLV
jgi:hypothetical protein